MNLTSLAERNERNFSDFLCINVKYKHIRLTQWNERTIECCRCAFATIDHALHAQKHIRDICAHSTITVPFTHSSSCRILADSTHLWITFKHTHIAHTHCQPQTRSHHTVHTLTSAMTGDRGHIVRQDNWRQRAFGKCISETARRRKHEAALFHQQTDARIQAYHLNLRQQPHHILYMCVQYTIHGVSFHFSPISILITINFYCCRWIFTVCRLLFFFSFSVSLCVNFFSELFYTQASSEPRIAHVSP